MRGIYLGGNMKYILKITNKQDNTIMYFKSKSIKKEGFRVVYNKETAKKLQYEDMREVVNYLIDTKEIEYYNVEIIGV